MRGKEAEGDALLNAYGITPAHAGKRNTHKLNLVILKDHPRACGEKPVAMHSLTIKAGSPPRMRGKVYCVSKVRPRDGITPAHAGKSLLLRLRSILCRDHPRACGEKMYASISICAVWGSPPRMRGKAVLFRMFHGGDGITPAHAGKRKPTLPAERQTRDHPRACGEKKRSQSQPGRLRGSPPRMRGKARPQQFQGLCLRITPAHAGKRQSASYPQQRPRDHPRACGEKHTWKLQHRLFPGSPPRMRGKVVSSNTRLFLGGITPAHAGKRMLTLTVRNVPGDHPRACGEKSV